MFAFNSFTPFIVNSLMYLPKRQEKQLYIACLRHLFTKLTVNTLDKSLLYFYNIFHDENALFECHGEDKDWERSLRVLGINRPRLTTDVEDS